MRCLQVKKPPADCALLLAYNVAVHKKLRFGLRQQLTCAMFSSACRGNEGMMAARPGATSCPSPHVRSVFEPMLGEEVRCQHCICPQAIGRAPNAPSRTLQVGRSAKTATNHRLGEQLPLPLRLTIVLWFGPRLT